MTYVLSTSPGFFDHADWKCSLFVPARKFIYLENVKSILSKQEDMKKVMHFLTKASYFNFCDFVCPNPPACRIVIDFNAWPRPVSSAV